MQKFIKKLLEVRGYKFYMGPGYWVMATISITR